MKWFLIILLLFSLLLTTLQAQPTLWQLKLSNGNNLSNAILKELIGDSLSIIHEESENSIHINSIVEIRNIRESSFWVGAKVGSLSGVAIGVIGGLLFSKKGGGIAGDSDIHKPVAAIGGGIYLGVIGGLLGGIIGSISGIDEVHNLSQMITPLKRHKLNSLILREKLENDKK